MQRRFALHDTAGLAQIRIWLGVTLHHVYPGHNDAIITDQLCDCSALALVFAGNNNDFIFSL